MKLFPMIGITIVLTKVLQLSLGINFFGQFSLERDTENRKPKTIHENPYSARAKGVVSIRLIRFHSDKHDSDRNMFYLLIYFYEIT